MSPGLARSLDSHALTHLPHPRTTSLYSSLCSSCLVSGRGTYWSTSSNWAISLLSTVAHRPLQAVLTATGYHPDAALLSGSGGGKPTAVTGPFLPLLEQRRAHHEARGDHLGTRASTTASKYADELPVSSPGAPAYASATPASLKSDGCAPAPLPPLPAPKQQQQQKIATTHSGTQTTPRGPPPPKATMAITPPATPSSSTSMGEGGAAQPQLRSPPSVPELVRRYEPPGRHEKQQAQTLVPQPQQLATTTARPPADHEPATGEPGAAGKEGQPPQTQSHRRSRSEELLEQQKQLFASEQVRHVPLQLSGSKSDSGKAQPGVEVPALLGVSEGPGTPHLADAAPQQHTTTTGGRGGRHHHRGKGHGGGH